jgi:hypothetical protein
MEAVTPVDVTEVRFDERRARFREAVSGLSGRARSGDLLKMLLLPAALLVILGFNFLLWGWWGAAHTHRQIEQIPYLISGGLVGLGFVVLGGLLLATSVWVASVERMRKESEERSAAHLAELVTIVRPPEPTPAPTTATRSRNGTRTKATSG